MADVAHLITRVSADTAQAEQGLRRVGNEVDNTAKKGNALTSAFGGLTSGLSKLGLAANGVQAIFTGIGGVISALGVTTAANFQETMSGIQAVLAPTTAEMEKLRAKALQLGADTAFSASEAGMAIEALAQNGLFAKDILGGAADATVALAAATKTDLTTAATIATDTMMAFGLEASQLMTAVDGIAGVTVASKFGIDDYRLALANGGGAAAAFGVSLEDFNAVIAATSAQFTSGQTAGTAFRTFINRLTPNSNEASAAMAELGLMTANGTSAFYTATGAIRPMAEVAGILQKALGGLTDAQKAAYIETIFGAEAIGTVIGLTQQGAAGVEAFAASIDKVDAAAQAATRLDNFNGVLEAFRGSLDSLKIIIGTAVLPALTSLFQWLTNVINVVSQIATAVTSAANPFQEFANQVSTVIASLLGLSTEANSYGAALVQSFASGIASAFGAVVSVLQEIGSIVSYWLAPGSPPRIVPDLDTYGADAATVFFDGWRDGDYSALQEIGGIVQQTLSGLVDSGMFNEEDVIPRVLGTRGALQDAISQLKETGSISQEMMDKIVDAAGPVGETIRGFVTSYADLENATQAVKDAQDELNRVQDEYNNKLAPLNSELDLIQQKKKALQDAQRIEKLNEKIADGKTTDSERAIALLEIEEIQKRQQIDAVNAEKDAAIDSAQAKVDAAKKIEDAAKENLATQKAAIAATNAQNQMIGQQTALLERLAKANAASAGGGGSGGGSALGKIKAGIPKPGDLMGDIAQVTTPIREIGTAITDTKQRFIDFKLGVADSVDSAKQVVVSGASVITGAFSGMGASLGGIFGQVTTLANSVISTIVGYWQTNGASLVATAQTTFNTLVSTVTSIISALLPIISGILAQIQIFWNTHGADIMAFIGATWTQIQVIIQTALQLIQAIVVPILGAISEYVNTHGDEIQAALSGAWLVISTIVTTTLAIIQGVITTALQIINGDWAGAWNTIQQTCATIVLGIVAVIQGFLTTAEALFSESWQKIFNDVSVVWNLILSTVSTIVNDMVTDLQTKANTAKTLLLTAWNDISADVTTTWNTILTNIQTFVSDIITKFETLKTDALRLWEDIKTAITTAIDDVKTYISGKVEEIKTSAAGVGTGIIDGIKKGISDGWAALTGFVSQKATELLNAAKSTLGIQSPSKVFADLVGKMIPQGIAIGITQGTASAIGAIKELSSKLISEAFSLTASFLRAKAQAQEGLQDLMPDDKKFRALQSRIHKFQEAIAEGDKSEKTRDRLEKSLALRVEMLAAMNGAQEELNEAEAESNRLRAIDAKLGNDFYDMRVRQIMEIAKLEKDKQQAKKQDEKDRIQAQLDLLKAAQEAELAAFQAHIEDVQGELAQAIQETIRDIAARINDLVRESLAGIAGLSRGMAGTRRAVRDMMPDKSIITGMIDELKALKDEERRLRVTAAQNIDPEKRAEAEARLLEIEKERAEIEKKLAQEKKLQALQTDIAVRTQNELNRIEAEALKLRKIDPKLADEFYDLKSGHILELAALEQEMALAKTDADREAIALQIKLTREAQEAELKLFNETAAARQKELEELAQDAGNAATDIGEQFVEIMQAGLLTFTNGLSAFMASLGITLPPTGQAPTAGLLASSGGAMSFASQPQTIAASGGNTPLIGTLTIDARGSKATKAEIEAVVNAALDRAIEKAKSISRTK